MGATAAAAVLALEERQIVEAYQNVRAINPGAARVPSDVGVRETAMFARLVSSGVLRHAGAGAYYLDESSWEAQRRVRRRAIVVVAAAAIIAVIVLCGTLLLRGARR